MIFGEHLKNQTAAGYAKVKLFHTKCSDYSLSGKSFSFNIFKI